MFQSIVREQAFVIHFFVGVLVVTVHEEKDTHWLVGKAVDAVEDKVVGVVE